MAASLSGFCAIELRKEALSRVPGYLPGDRVVSMAGGAVNATHVVETESGSFIVKFHAPKGPLLGVDHAREACLQSAAAAAGIAPAIVHVDSLQRFMITRYIDGRVWNVADFSNPVQLRKLGATLRSVHAVQPPIPASFDLRAVMLHFVTHIASLQPSQQPSLEHEMSQAEASLRESGTESRAPTLFHSDPHHSNIIETESGLTLIDWEYAAVGDPLFDLGCILAYYPQARPYAQELLDASGLADVATLAMLQHATSLYLLLNSLWERACGLGAVPSAGVR